MKNFSTLYFFLNKLTQEESEEFNKLELLFDSDIEEYDEVFEYLDSFKRDVREKVVREIMLYAKKSPQHTNTNDTEKKRL